MSDYHILGGLPDGNKLIVVMHFPVPDVGNEVGVNYRTIVALLRTGTSMVPWISAAEQAALDAGELYEWAMTPAFSTFPAETLLQKRARMDALYTSSCAATQARLAEELRFWGYDRDVGA